MKTPFRRRRSIYTHFSGAGEVLIYTYTYMAPERPGKPEKYLYTPINIYIQHTCGTCLHSYIWRRTHYTIYIGLHLHTYVHTHIQICSNCTPYIIKHCVQLSSREHAGLSSKRPETKDILDCEKICMEIDKLHLSHTIYYMYSELSHLSPQTTRCQLEGQMTRKRVVGHPTASDETGRNIIR